MEKNRNKELKRIEDEKLIPNPGTDEALYMGCTCPVLDNHHGAGALVNGENMYWIAQDCPIHNHN